MLDSVIRVLLPTLIAMMCCLPLAARAQTDALEEARAMVEGQEFEAAQEALTTLLESGDLDLEQLVEVYRLLAESAAALRQPDAATDAFIRLLVIQPDFYVASSASPLLREPFEQALAHWNENERPTFRYRPPESIDSNEPFIIALEIDQEALPSLFAVVRLHYRASDGDLFASVDLDNGRGEVSEDHFEDADQLAIYLTAHDSYGNVVASVGSPDEPLRIGVGEASEAQPVQDPDGRQRERRPVYQRWWFWTIIGTAVVGLAVGLPVGLTRSTPDDPCESALGGPCDLVVDLGQ
jgi:tetratricopeptide (TPR) repeat protein